MTVFHTYTDNWKAVTIFKNTLDHFHLPFSLQATVSKPISALYNY